MTTNLPANTVSNSPTNYNMLPSQSEFQMFQVIAANAKKSGLYGGDESKIFMVMLAARELGISPMLALNGGIWNISGKIEISARLMNSMIRRAGHKMQIKSTNSECTIIAKRSDTGEEHTEVFTMAMAQIAGLANGNVWKKYPEDMLYNRCMSRLARRLFPDVIGVAYVEGEISEAKEIERQEKLPQAEYQDITVHQDNTDVQVLQETEIQKERTLSAEQLHEIHKLYCQTDQKFKDNFGNHMVEKWKAACMDDIPEKFYNSIIQGMLNNINLNKEKVI